ncbi:hypothetical protein ACJJTC_006999 [Scirpophaga incertulas]
MATVDEIKKNRKICRMMCTLSAKKIEEVISLGKPDLEIQTLYEAFKVNVEKLFKTDDELRTNVLSDSTIEEDDMLQILDLEETMNRSTQYNLLLAKFYRVPQAACRDCAGAAHTSKAVSPFWVQPLFYTLHFLLPWYPCRTHVFAMMR